MVMNGGWEVESIITVYASAEGLHNLNSQVTDIVSITASNPVSDYRTTGPTKHQELL